MLIVYDSYTGNVRRFINKISYPSIQVVEGLFVQEPFVLVTYTFGSGEVPVSTLEFLKNNHKGLLGVSVSGNKNWGDNYGKSGDIIAASFRVPLISKFEQSGSPRDLHTFMEGVEKVYALSRIEQ